MFNVQCSMFGHHVFRKAGITEKPHLQKDSNKAKDYQLRQIRTIILKYELVIRVSN